MPLELDFEEQDEQEDKHTYPEEGEGLSLDDIGSDESNDALAQEKIEEKVKEVKPKGRKSKKVSMGDYLETRDDPADELIEPSEDLALEQFHIAPLPSMERIEEDPKVGGKAKVFIGEYCLCLGDSRNFDVFKWVTEIPKRGRYVKRATPVSKFKLIGHFSSLQTACIAISNDLDRDALSSANQRHLADAIEYLKRRRTEMMKSICNISLIEMEKMFYQNKKLRKMALCNS